MIHLNKQRKIITVLLITFISIVGIESKMLYTFSLMRHGAEYPKNDLYDGNETKQFRGKLTPIGLRQQYNLGTYLKQNYITEEKLSTPKFNPDQVEFYSTSFKKAHNSALAFIYGFYPLGQGWIIPPEVPSDKWNPPYTPLFPEYLQKQESNDIFALNKGFQPLPVRQLDDILNNCPTYYHLLNEREILLGSQIKSFEEKFSDEIEKLANIFKLNEKQKNLKTIADLYDTVISDLNLGRKMPSDFYSSDLKDLKFMNEIYRTLVFNGNLAKVLSTPMLRMIRAKLNGVINKSKVKFSFLFGHQPNLHTLITILNLTNTDCLTEKWEGKQVTHLNCVDPPAFSANMILQLHEYERSSSYYVQIRYNGYYVNLCETTSTECEYNQFVNRLKNIETKFEEQCGLKSNDLKIEEQ